MDVYKTRGAFSWNELMTPDPAAAIEYSRKLLALRVVALSLCDPDAADELAAALPSHSAHQDQDADVLELEMRDPAR